MTGAHGRPYVGLRPYETGELALFFGRYRESHEVASLWLGSRLLTLHGPSGVGKTSLINAGATPIVSAHADVLPVGRVSRESAFSATLGDHNPYTLAVLSSWSPGDTPAHLAGMSVVDFLTARATRTDRYGDRLPILAGIDRFEEVFHDSPGRWRYRDEFIRDLAVAVERVPQLRLLIAIRDDSLAELLSHEVVIAGHARARFRVRPFHREAALDAVKRPAETTDRSFAPGVAEQVVDNLRTVQFTDSIGENVWVMTDVIEPAQLQVVCSELWLRLPDDVHEITSEYLDDHGDPSRELARFARDAIARTAENLDMSEPELRDWLRRTFDAQLGRRVTIHEAAGTTDELLGAVSDALEEHLSHKRYSGPRWYESAHDRVVQPIRRMKRPRSVPSVSAADSLRAARIALADDLALAQKHALDALRLSGGEDARIEAEAESLLADIELQHGGREAAERRYHRAAQLFEMVQDQVAVGRSLAALGALRLDQGQYAAAIEEWQGAVARLPGDPTVRVQLARALFCAGQPRAAVAVYGSVLAVAPESPAVRDALAGRGQVRADLGDASDALEDLRRLVALLPQYEHHPDVRSARGLALAELGRFDEAESEDSAAREVAPDDGVVLIRAAKVARIRGDHEAARELAVRALRARTLLPHQEAEARRLLDLPATGGTSA